MKPAVLHIDIENNIRGGQKQSLMLYSALLNKSIKTNFICKSASELQKYLVKNKMNYYSLSFISSYSLIQGFKIAKYARDNAYNIIHCHSSDSLNLGIIAKFFNRKLKVIGSRRVVFPVKNKMKYNSLFLDKIITVSDAVKNQMLKSGVDENKLITIHSGIPLYEIKKTTSSGIKQKIEFANSFIVGTTAAFTNEKDYPTLIEVAKIVTKKNPKIKFVFLGKGPLFEDIKKLVNDYNLIYQVFFFGYVNEPLKYIKDFDIYVTSTKSEGLGTSILDAMALGKPVIATNTGGIPEIVRHNKNGILFDKGDYHSLAEAILELYENTDKRNAMSKKSIEIIKEFDIDKTVEKTLELYEAMLNGEK